MSNKIDVLKRRALSGKEGSGKALEELCSMTSNPSIFIDVLSVFHRFLTQHRPPESVIDGAPAVEIASVLNIFTAIFVGVGLRKGISYKENIIMTSLRKSWPVIHSWCSCLVKSYLEHDLDTYGELGPQALSVINVVAVLFAVLRTRDVIRLHEIRSIEGSGKLFVRIHLYALLVESTSPVYLPPRKPRMEVAECSSMLYDVFWRDGDWESFRARIYTPIIEDFNPRLMSVIARVLAHLAQAPTLNYQILYYWLRVLSNVVAESDTFNRRLFVHRSVYFATRIVRRLSKALSHPENGPDLLKDRTFWGAWRWSVQYIYLAIEYGGFDNLVMALESGFILALRKLSKVTMQNTHPSQMIYTPMELFGTVIELISGYSLYRSIQKPLKRIFAHPLLKEIDSDLLREKSEDERLWSRFKKVVLERIAIRYDCEARGIMLCSNPECESLPTKVYRCSGCTIAFYCDPLCQKSHWMKAHRQECHEHRKDHESGLPRMAEERDRKIAQKVFESVLYPMRSQLLQQHITYRKSLRTPSAAVLLSLVDFTTSEPEKDTKILTLDEAGKLMGKNWGDLIRGLKEMQQEGVDAGPIVAVKVPHSRQTMSMYTILRKFDDDEDMENNYENLLEGRTVYSARHGNEMVHSTTPMVHGEDGTIYYPLIGAYTPSPDQ